MLKVLKDSAKQANDTAIALYAALPLVSKERRDAIAAEAARLASAAQKAFQFADMLQSF